MNLSFYFSGINTKSVTEYGIFSFIRNCRTFFQSDCTIYIRTTKVWSSSSASFPAWYCHYFLILSILVDMLGCVIVGLICIFPMSSKVKHLFMRLFPSLSSSAKCLFMSLGLFFFFFSYCWIFSVLYIFWIRVLCWICILKIQRNWKTIVILKMLRTTIKQIIKN